MKKIGISLIILFLSIQANTQNSPDIMGLYNLGSSSPAGGSHLFVLENGNYAITYFGGVQNGKWKNTQGNIYEFTPNLNESTFELSGRYNKDLKNKTKIFFNSFENSETFIQLRTAPEEKYTMQRVFNKGANCFSYPYVNTFKTTANSVSFMSIQHNDDDTNPSIITIKNQEGYNDFIVNFIEVDSYEAEPFLVTFKENKLYFKDGNFSDRSPLNEEGEDIQFIKSMIKMEANRDTIYFNPSYNMFGQFVGNKGRQNIHEHHVFNEQKDAFIDTKYYVEGQENIKSDDSFENMAIIYAYKVLKNYTKESVKYKINKKALFHVNCN
ncbi:MAG: hypothetical protein V3U92_14530 [Cellulophaga sp.]